MPERRVLTTNLGFGLERVGLMGVRAPWLTLCLVVAITLAAAFGASLLRSGSTLMQLFRSHTESFAEYERFRADFPASDADILVVVEGDDLFTPTRIAALRDLHVELQLAAPVAGVVSIFSIPDAPSARGRELPLLLPREFPDPAELPKLKERVSRHPLVSGRLFTAAAERESTLFLVGLKSEANLRPTQDASIRAITSILDQQLAGTGLASRLLGAPIMESEIRAAGRHDRVVFNLAGLTLGILICFAFFGRWRPVLIATACPVLALIWTMGLLGALERETTTIMNAIPPLILAVTYCDSMHMVFAVRRRLRDGSRLPDAVRHAVLNVGPACVLTSLTTSLALFTLLLADSAVINSFGRSAAIAVLLALLAVLLLTPALSMLMLGVEEGVRSRRETRFRAERWLDDAAQALAVFVGRHARTITVTTVVLTVMFGTLHLQLRPTFQLSAQVPDSVRAAMQSTQEKNDLALTTPVQIVLRLPAGTDFHAADARAAIHEIHEALASHPDVRSVFSFDVVRGWLADLKSPAARSAEQYLDRLPTHLRRRLVNERGDAALVTGFLPDVKADKTVEILSGIEERLAPVRKAHADKEITITGLPALAATSSTRMIEQLNLGLLSAIVLVTGLLGLAFASWAVPLISILPNLLPLVTIGAALWFLTGGLDYTSVIALTVAFGLAVDNTIHFLNALRLQRGRVKTLARAVAASIQQVGPVILVTTCVLVLGIGTTVLSSLPPSRAFGILCMGTLAAALVADLVALPALILMLRRDILGSASRIGARLNLRPRRRR